MGRQSGGDWGEYVTLDKTFYSIPFKQEAVATQLLPNFLPYCVPRECLYYKYNERQRGTWCHVAALRNPAYHNNRTLYHML